MYHIIHTYFVEKASIYRKIYVFSYGILSGFQGSLYLFDKWFGIGVPWEIERKSEPNELGSLILILPAPRASVVVVSSTVAVAISSTVAAVVAAAFRLWWDHAMFVLSRTARFCTMLLHMLMLYDVVVYVLLDHWMDMRHDFVMAKMLDTLLRWMDHRTHHLRFFTMHPIDSPLWFSLILCNNV